MALPDLANFAQGSFRYLLAWGRICPATTMIGARRNVQCFALTRTGSRSSVLQRKKMHRKALWRRRAFLAFRTAQFALVVVFLVIGVSAPPLVAYAQAGFEDDRVMIQGFYWESSRHGYQQKFPQFGSEHWYAIIAREAPKIRAARFDLIWLPPPSFAGGFSAGYDPREYFVLDNSLWNLHGAARRTGGSPDKWRRTDRGYRN